MIIDILLILVPFITFTGYISFIIKKFGVQKSISFSDIIVNKPYKWFFEITMFICGISLLLFGYLNNILLLSISGGLIFCVGLFPLGDRPKWVYYPHMLFAILGFVIGIFSFWINRGLFEIPSITAVISGIVLLLARKKLWGVEVAVSYGIFMGLLEIILFKYFLS